MLLGALGDCLLVPSFHSAVSVIVRSGLGVWIEEDEYLPSIDSGGTSHGVLEFMTSTFTLLIYISVSLIESTQKV